MDEFTKLTTQLLELDPSARTVIAWHIAWRLIRRMSLVNRLAILTSLLSLILLVILRPYQLADLLIVIAGGYTIAFNIIQVSKFIRRYASPIPTR